MTPLQNKNKHPYTPPNRARPYICNLCHAAFAERDAVRHDHHYNYRRKPSEGCWTSSGKPAGAVWWDHPSCSTVGGRPFYPDWDVSQPEGGRLLLWYAQDVGVDGEGLPTEEAELLRQNEAYRLRPDANPWFVTGVPYTAEQRAEDESLGRFNRDGSLSRLAVQVREEEACLGEDPEAQLLLLCAIVTPESYAELLRVSRTEEEWESGTVDDIFLAVALHTSDEDLAARLGLAVDEILDWLEQAIDNFAAVHFLASDGRARLAGGEERDEVVDRIRERRIDAASGEWMQLSCCRNDMRKAVEAEVSSPTPV
ncbi:hypothetical protein LTR91_009452 [Friedmanniomyces endolithicus]|uniref:Uncharacterized protein n=1 Tax=Friedmanniomyces endolithicus TaxID=329885 RepID=A0AAN6FWP9_9PEZI|nr:hypothetical protein LTR35_002500 [Friedmanniomyces endolithicus]KAK0295741.1 hypothetical protein LTS00_005481 [Friedmanniomyces endolithicus]KAK0325712.1 hypothetical protein LTR82_003249 [Friedmanniomyces endolithicus]KAK0926844.1 hypothetical protein LTR57_003887 [Friedmanniomyces endolithicus]KAK0984463.1 hypothetical protein LTS01_010681 [Friedmanniomyces endolithicus]